MKKHEALGLDELNEIGSRLSGKSLNAEIFLILACNMLDYANKPIKVDVFGFRYETQDKADLYQDFLTALDYVVKEYPSLKYRTIKDKLFFPKTGSSIKIYGMTSRNSHKTKKTGLPHSSAEYIFKFLEERAEYPFQEVQDIDEAVRGIGNDYKMMSISCANPRTLSNEYIKWCNSHLKFSEGILRGKHYQILVKEIPLDDGISKKVMFLYNN
jgi:hypothetical protein